MKKLLLPALLLVATLGSALALDYKAVPDWVSFPDGKKIIGNMHGDVAVASNGEVYVSVMDPKAGLQVFSPDGKWERNVPNAPPAIARITLSNNKRLMIRVLRAPRVPCHIRS